MPIALGIDLGTTNSVAAWQKADSAEFVVDSNGNRVHPSIVYYPENNQAVVGAEAKEQLGLQPANTLYSTKRLLGKSIEDPKVQLLRQGLPFVTIAGSNGQTLIEVNNKPITVPQVSAEILGWLQQKAQSQFDEQVVDAVITVPANFSNAQRQATKTAAQIAKLNVLRLVNEPTAAALAYGYGNTMDAIIAIYDFGGGTFDVSILQVRDNVFEVLASDGDFFLGGDDIDRALAIHLAGELNKSHGQRLASHPQTLSRLRIAAEQIKCHLSQESKAEGQIGNLVIGKEVITLPFSVTRKKLESLAVGYINQTMDLCHHAIAASGVSKQDITDVICVGGSTRIPLVRKRLADTFGKAPRTDIDPDVVVAHGAAIQARTLSLSSISPADLNRHSIGNTSGSVADIITQSVNPLLLDVVSASLGVATTKGFCETIIAKNSPIPIESTKTFSPVRPDQTAVVLQCCRGQSNRFADNEKIGTLHLAGIKRSEDNLASIAVTFRIDGDGVLQVKAVDVESGIQQHAVLHLIGAPIIETRDATLLSSSNEAATRTQPPTQQSAAPDLDLSHTDPLTANDNMAESSVVAEPLSFDMGE